MSTDTGEHTPNTHELSDEELSNATGGSFNAFANFGDVKGESTDKGYKDWLAAARGSSVVSASEIVVTKRSDGASL